MNNIHNRNINFLKELFKKERFNFIDYKGNLEIKYFNSGWGTHLYLTTNNSNKYLARINFYPWKNEWWVKKLEYDVLKLLEWYNISPKVYYFNDNNSLKQDLTIVEYIEGEVLKNIDNKSIISLANTLKKLHNSFTFTTSWDLPPSNKLPYKCDIYDIFANGDDKKIENYSDLVGIEKVIEPYNRIKNKLWDYFHNLTIFDSCNNFSLCHADLKKENVLINDKWIMLIDWECATSDIHETDIWRLFAGCSFTEKQQKLFLENYYDKNINNINLDRIYAVKKVLDFFKIFEDYVSLKRKEWCADNMLIELLEYEKNNYNF